MPDYKAFVSSTFVDLKDHRAHVIEALRKAGFFVDPMEDWTAAADEPKTFSQKRVEGCDLCILLVAFRRGTVPENETESITQMEYRYAMEHGIDVLPFLLADDAPWPRQLDERVEDPDTNPALMHSVWPWRTWLRGHHGVGSFSTGPKTIEIEAALIRWFTEREPQSPKSIPKRTSPAARTPAYWLGRPASLGDGFVGRDAEIKAVEAALKDKKGAVVSGGPGTGKSRLAAEYVHERGGNGFWTDAGSNVSETLAALAPSLGVETGTRSTDEIAAEVERALAGESAETLWVIDSLTDLNLVNELLKRSGEVQLLVTTRDSRRQLLPGTVSFIPLESLEQAAAVKLLISRSKYRATKVPKEIASRVGCLPLALEMLAVRLGEPKQTPKKLLGEFEKAATAVDVSAFEKAAGATIPRADGVYGAIGGSLDALDPEVRRIIAPLGYLADAPITEALFMAITDTDEATLDKVLQECSHQSILTVRDGEIVMHALTTAAVAATNADDVFETAMERAHARLARIAQDDPVACRAEVVHYEQVRKRLVARTGIDEPLTLGFTHNLAIGYSVLGRYDEALALFEETLAIRERVLGAENHETLNSRAALAEGFRLNELHEKALALNEELLPVYECVYGPEHVNTLMIRSNLAINFRDLGSNDDAVKMDEETLAVRERVLGPEHPETLTTRHNLAIGYWKAERNEEAVALEEETLIIRERVLGLEHPRTLGSRDSVAVGYAALGRHDEAVPLHEETLAARERVLGPEHPDTLTTRNNLANGYRALGKTDHAGRLYEDVLAVRERLLGPEHPDTLTSRSNLAVGYRSLGRDAEAVALDEVTLATRERVLGPEHPHTLMSRSNLALGYRALGRDAEAEALEGKLKKRKARGKPKAPRQKSRRKKKKT